GVVDVRYRLRGVAILPGGAIQPDGRVELFGAFVLAFPGYLSPRWVRVARVLPPVQNILPIDNRDGRRRAIRIVNRVGADAPSWLILVRGGVEDVQLGELLTHADARDLGGPVRQLRAAQLDHAVADLEWDPLKVLLAHREAGQGVARIAASMKALLA